MLYQSWKILKRHILVLRYSGVWPDKEDSCLCYTAYTIIIILVCFLFFPIGIWRSLIISDTLSDFIFKLPPSIYPVFLSTKTISLIYKKRSFRKLFDLLAELEEAAAQTIEEKNAIKKSQFEAKCLFIGIGVINALYTTGNAFLAITNDERKLMWPSVYPFNWENSLLLYYLTLSLQYFVTMYFALITMPLEINGPACFIMLSTFLNILGKRLSCLGGHELEMSYVKHDKNVTSATINQKRIKDQLNLSAIIECIKLHKLCIK